jgi:hypothetical protein
VARRMDQAWKRQAYPGRRVRRAASGIPETARSAPLRICSSLGLSQRRCEPGTIWRWASCSSATRTCTEVVVATSACSRSGVLAVSMPVAAPIVFRLLVVVVRLLDVRRVVFARVRQTSEEGAYPCGAHELCQLYQRAGLAREAIRIGKEVDARRRAPPRGRLGARPIERHVTGATERDELRRL